MADLSKIFFPFILLIIGNLLIFNFMPLEHEVNKQGYDFEKHIVTYKQKETNWLPILISIAFSMIIIGWLLIEKKEVIKMRSSRSILHDRNSQEELATFNVDPNCAILEQIALGDHPQGPLRGLTVFNRKMRHIYMVVKINENYNTTERLERSESPIDSISEDRGTLDQFINARKKFGRPNEYAQSLDFARKLNEKDDIEVQLLTRKAEQRIEEENNEKS